MNTKDRILEASLKLFNEKGVASITTNHIADGLGISPGSLYYHFKNKEEIIRALFIRMNESLEDTFQFSKENPLDMENLLELFKKNFMLILDYPLFAREFITLVQRDAELLDIFYQMKKRRFEQIESILLGLIETGIMRRPTNGVTLQGLIEMIWVMAFFWTPHLLITEQPLNVKSLEKGMEMVLNIIRPYLNADY